jgi:hypothetical protein
MLFTPFQLLSQEVIGSQGDFSSTPSGSLSWTIGEVITTTVSNGSEILTQGFQQIILSDAGIWENFSTRNVGVYPNPFHSNLTIINNALEGEHQLMVIDNSGKIIYMSSLNFSSSITEHTVQLSQLASGIYQLSLISEGTNVHTTRIVKY